MSYRDSPLPSALARRHLWLACAAVMTLVLLSACGKKAPETDTAVPVIALPVQAADGTSMGRFPGDIHARYEMPLSFRVNGQLAARFVNPGDVVKKGQALAKLDDADATRAQASSQAALDAAEHRLLFATQQRDRDDAQAKQNLISQLQLEQTHDAYASALAARDQAKQQLELAQNQLHYDTLMADHDGAITSQQADVGQVLAAGQAVFGFAWSGEREVFFDVPESQFADITVGQPATATVSALPGHTYTGHVREIAPAADPQSRTYRVKLSLDQSHADQSLAPLQLGMTAQVALSAGTSSGANVRIPVTALFHQGEHPAVWVVRAADSTLELRPITVTRYEERDVLIGAGLTAGEQVVMQGVHAVSAGEKVTVVAPPHPEDAPR